MTANQLALDPNPGWPTDCQPTDHTPTPYDCRQHEIRDLHGQGAGPAALWTARDIPARRYL